MAPSKAVFPIHAEMAAPAGVLIQPDDILYDDNSPFNAKVIRMRFRGANSLYTSQVQSDKEALALVSSHHNHTISQKIGISPQVDKIILFETGGCKHQVK